jgi:hypothetical protein
MSNSWNNMFLWDTQAKLYDDFFPYMKEREIEFHCFVSSWDIIFVNLVCHTYSFRILIVDDVDFLRNIWSFVLFNFF